MILIPYLMFSTLTGLIIGTIYGWKAGLLSAILWPVGLGLSVWEWLFKIAHNDL